MEYVLETNNLGKKYKNDFVLKHLNMHIKPGSIYGLIGENGAGKTTLIRIICGLQRPTSGIYSIYGINNRDKNIEDVRKRMSAMIETPAIYGDLSAKDNLIEQYKLVGIPEYDSAEELLKFVGLEDTGKKKAKHFSLGMKQRLGIALTLVTRPDFLILDEPINGLDPKGMIEIREIILKLKKEKDMTILISSHYLDELSKIATHYGFLENGCIIQEISSAELKKKLEHKFILKVNQPSTFVKFLEEKKISYEIVDSQTIHVYGKKDLSKFIIALSKENLKVEEIHETEETLETYYMNLIGGGKID